MDFVVGSFLSGNLLAIDAMITPLSFFRATRHFASLLFFFIETMALPSLLFAAEDKKSDAVDPGTWPKLYEWKPQLSVEITGHFSPK